MKLKTSTLSLLCLILILLKPLSAYSESAPPIEIQDRRVDQAHDKLWEHLQAQPIAGYEHLWVPRTPKRAAREAKLAIRFAPVRIKAPQGKTKLKAVDL